MDKLVGRILDCEVIIKSPRSDWYVLKTPNSSRNVFLHISDCNDDPHLDVSDNLKIYIIDFNTKKNRYSGSLKIRDRLFEIIDELKVSKCLTAKELDELEKSNFLDIVENLDFSQSTVNDLIMNIRKRNGSQTQYAVEPSSFINVMLYDNMFGEELEACDNFYVTPYHKYNTTSRNTLERLSSLRILDVKRGVLSEIKRLVSKLDDIIPNREVVLTFVPSSTANKKYFAQFWNENERRFVDDKDRPINPPLADLIYCLTGTGYSYNAELSSRYEYYKVFEESKRIDGSTLIERFKSIESAHGGGKRSVSLHLNSIRIKNADLVKDREVWLIDDVVTTGSSLTACKTLLMRSGAKNVKCLAIGKTTKITNSTDNCYEDDLPF
jgi:adenine/guanine phosphoribosyltransferase-like PRPP-binding protein